MTEPSCGATLWRALCAAAAAGPGEPAIRDGSRSLTGRELARAVGAAALRLRETLAPASRVGVRLAPGADQHVAILAILVASCVYVPLDVTWSAERTAYVCGDAEVALVIGDGPPGTRSLPFAELGPDATVPDLGAAVARLDTTPVPPVYVMYTSGTTGAPKGVETTWQALRNRLAWMQDVHPLGPADVVLSKTSCGFDVSVWEYLWPRLHGARTAVLDVRAADGWSALWRMLREENVTVCHFVPSVARAALRDPEAGPVPGLRLVALSGEVLDRDTAAALQRLAPGARIVNMYGPTECAIDVSHWTFDERERWDPVPIGGGAPGCGLTLRPSGELVISGVQVARGYLGAAAGSGGFTPDGTAYATGDTAVEVEPGVYSVLGRADRQVKLNGVRVELDGLEAVVRTHPQIEDCAAVLDGEDPGSRRLVLACRLRDPGSVPGTRGVREHVRATSAMEDVAFRLVPVDRLPLTSSGKTDYRALAHDLFERSDRAPHAGHRIH
ncbi:AMP-binding protein [Amycolatopsis sp. PS_44_ISF1]|uniref:AMP-binding protein n=1 Tax=Amycolatopsis sp. PS_44_ISF1 TaxID=2974917 RepID=UPI0028DD5DD6|nr:AMP-binding protein [Amycolatopsis sp. PS_44_ISF1]MDT8914981.1 AMP-binding protein [Amycolatopsis sp. PS_44_ISF1]